MAHPAQPTPAPSEPSTGLSSQRIAPGRFPESLTRHLIELQRGGFLSRLRDRRTDLWQPDPAHQAIAANRLGWLDPLPLITTHAPQLTAWARDARDRFDAFIMVGSSQDVVTKARRVMSP